MSTEKQIEEMIQEKGLNAPRLTSSQIDDLIKSKQFHVFDNTTVTVCCLTLQNGFNVLGESAAVSAKNFDKKIGKQVAFDNAREKIWQLEGYLLKQKMFERKKA